MGQIGTHESSSTSLEKRKAEDYGVSLEDVGSDSVPRKERWLSKNDETPDSFFKGQNFGFLKLEKAWQNAGQS